jgi:hypothetical protein
LPPHTHNKLLLGDAEQFAVPINPCTIGLDIVNSCDGIDVKLVVTGTAGNFPGIPQQSREIYEIRLVCNLLLTPDVVRL